MNRIYNAQIFMEINGNLTDNEFGFLLERAIKIAFEEMPMRLELLSITRVADVMEEKMSRVKRVIDAKYHIDDQYRIIKTSNDDPVSVSEPTILFRGRDLLALPMLKYYKQLCIDDGCTQYQIESMDEMIKRFQDFADTSKTMKQPGVTEGK